MLTYQYFEMMLQLTPRYLKIYFLTPFTSINASVVLFFLGSHNQWLIIAFIKYVLEPLVN